MLPERCLELLTAYVDGELSARRRRQVSRLLRHSAEARALLKKLQNDSDALIHLPRVRPDRDLSATVLQKIADSRPLAGARSGDRAPTRARRLRAPHVYPAWIGAAAAAVVLLSIGAASYCFFASALGRPTAPAAIAQARSDPSGATPDVAPPADGAAPHHDPVLKGNPVPVHTGDEVAHQTPADPNPPPVMEKDEPIFTSEGMELFNELKAVTPSADVPATFKVRELEDDAVHKKLVAELKKDAALRLELPIPDGTRAFERLQPLLKAHHVELLIDATARRRLANPKARTNYVLYTEDLTTDELAQLLKQLGAEDKKAAEKKTPDGLFDRLVVRRLTERDHKELANLLGVDPTPIQPKDVGPLGVDPRKPVSDLTGSQVAAALAKPGAKAAAEHRMLALPYNPVRPRHDSAEVKLFLDERKPLRPGALQVLLVLRGPTK